LNEQDCLSIEDGPSANTIHRHDTRSVCGSENVKSAHLAGRLRISNIRCRQASAISMQRCAAVPPGRQVG